MRCFGFLVTPLFSYIHGSTPYAHLLHHWITALTAFSSYSVINHAVISFLQIPSVSTYNELFYHFRINDYENFLCTLLLPKELRAYGLALRAFNVELATVHTQVSNRIAGEMRFQFWEDSIDGLFEGTAKEHPVCQQLLKVTRSVWHHLFVLIVFFVLARMNTC